MEKIGEQRYESVEAFRQALGEYQRAMGAAGGSGVHVVGGAPPGGAAREAAPPGRAAWAERG